MNTFKIILKTFIIVIGLIFTLGGFVNYGYDMSIIQEIASILYILTGTAINIMGIIIK